MDTSKPVPFPQSLHPPQSNRPGDTAPSIPDLLRERAVQAGAAAARTVAIAAPDRDPLTYQDLWRQVEDTVRKLNALGLGRNDRIAIVLPNGPELAVAFLAVASGATSAPLNPAYGAAEFDFYLADLRARALIVQAGMDSPARIVARSHGIPILELSPVAGAGAGAFTLEGARQDVAQPSGFAGAGDVALVLHTSGTTARPKVVPLTHARLCASALNIQAAFGLAPGDRCLNVMPLFHVHGLVAAILSSLVAGGSVVCTPGFEASAFFTWLSAFSPTWYTAVPTMHQAILASAAAHREIIARSPLRFIRSCSAPLPPQVMAALERAFDAPALESYGMTEAAHQIASNPLPPRQRKPGSVGVATGTQVAIMDERGRLLPPGETGEIGIRGANVIDGYENNPGANRQSFHDGWFRTGDQGRLDAGGYLFITGRIKELINRGGEKVAPREVDEALLEHPAVTQVVAFAVPHASLGEDVAAAVVLRADAATTEMELRQHAFSRLAEHKVPSQIVIVDDIPKGPTGKLQRMGLAERLASALQPAFVPPRSPVEERLGSIWAEVLELDRVGLDDNFFALGGDSLSATQVVSRVSALFQVDLPLARVFREPTLAAQAQFVEDAIVREIEALTDEEARRMAGQGRSPAEE